MNYYNGSFVGALVHVIIIAVIVRAIGGFDGRYQRNNTELNGRFECFAANCQIHSFPFPNLQGWNCPNFGIRYPSHLGAQNSAYSDRDGRGGGAEPYASKHGVVFSRHYGLYCSLLTTANSSVRIVWVHLGTHTDVWLDGARGRGAISRSNVLVNTIAPRFLPIKQVVSVPAGVAPIGIYNGNGWPTC